MSSQHALLVDIQKVLKKHKLWLSGSIKMRELNDNKWDESTAEAEIKDVLDYGYAKDKTGPFLAFKIHERTPKFTFNPKISKTVIMDKDHLLRDGVQSPITQEAFLNRREWNDHLKRNGCVELGTDADKMTGKKPVEGNFNCRKELTEATERVLSKYGH